MSRDIFAAMLVTALGLFAIGAVIYGLIWYAASLMP